MPAKQKLSCTKTCCFCYGLYVFKKHPHIKIHNSNQTQQAFNDMLRININNPVVEYTENIISKVVANEDVCDPSKAQIWNFLCAYRAFNFAFVQLASVVMFENCPCKFVDCMNMSDTKQSLCSLHVE